MTPFGAAHNTYHRDLSNCAECAERRTAIAAEAVAPWRKTLGAAALELHLFRAGWSQDHTVEFRDCEYETCAEARTLLATPEKP